MQDAATSAVSILCKESGSYPCAGRSNTGLRLTDGTGWVKADLSQKAVTVPSLPQDPLNNNDYHYTYCANSDTWEINAALESDSLRSRAYFKTESDSVKTSSRANEVSVAIYFLNQDCHVVPI